MPSERVVSPGVSLKERIAALQQRNGSISPPNLSPPGKVGSSSLQGAGALRDKIARFEVKGGVPVPRGSFGLGAPPVREDAALRRKGELYGNRIVSANAGKFTPPSGTNKDGQLSLRTSDGSPVQRKRCISTSVLSSYISDTTTRSDSSSPSVSIDIDNDNDSNTIPEDHSPILESPTRPTRRNSVSDVDAKRSSVLADGSDFNVLQKRDSILFPSTPTRGQATPPSPSRTITQEITDATVADELAAATDAEASSPEQRDEFAEVQKEVSDADTDRRHDAHQEIFPSSEVESTTDKVHVISSSAAEDVTLALVADKLELNESVTVEESRAPETPIPVVEPAPTTFPSPEPAEIPHETILTEPLLTEEPYNHNDLSSPVALQLSSSEESDPPSQDQPLPLPSLMEEQILDSNSPAEVEDGLALSNDDENPPVRETSSSFLHSQSMPAIVLSNAPTPREEVSKVNGSISPVTRSSSLHRPRSPNPIVLPPVPEQTYTELTLERTTGPKSFKAVVHGKKTHTKTPSPIDHQTQVVAPLNLRKGRSQVSSARRQQGAVPTSPRTPNSPDLSLLVAQAAQLEERLSGEPEVESIKEDDEGQEIILLQEVTMTQTTPNLGVDEFGRGPPISPSLQSLISNSSNDSKRRRSKSKSSKGRLPAIDDMGIPPTPPPKSAHWFKTLPASILSRNPSMGSESAGDRQSRASWSSEKSSEDSSAITTPPSPTFDLVTLPLAEDQFNHPGYRLGGRRSSSISSSSMLSSPKKSPSKKLMSRSSTFMSRMLSRAGRSNSTLALPDDNGSISDVPRASSPSPSHMSSSRSEHGLSTTSPQLAALISSRPTSTISSSSPASVLSSTLFDAFPAVPQDAPTPPPKSSLHFPIGNNAMPQSVSRSQSTLSKTNKREKISDPPSWYDEENGVHHSLLL